MKLFGFTASTRDGSINRELFCNVSSALKARGHALSIFDYSKIEDLPLYSAAREITIGVPATIRDMADQILAADGLVICSPEYNFSMPGPLKNAIDWLSRIKPYVTIGKPVLLMSASGSPLGGWRGLAALRVPLACLGAQTFAWDITVGSAKCVEEVKTIVATQAMRDRIDAAVSQFDLPELR